MAELQTIITRQNRVQLRGPNHDLSSLASLSAILKSQNLFSSQTSTTTWSFKVRSGCFPLWVVFYTVNIITCLWSWVLSIKILYYFKINNFNFTVEVGGQAVISKWVTLRTLVDFFRNRYLKGIDINSIFMKRPLRTLHLPNGFLHLLSPWRVLV
jgi:hypothetical protein